MHYLRFLRIIGLLLEGNNVFGVLAYRHLARPLGWRWSSDLAPRRGAGVAFNRDPADIFPRVSPRKRESRSFSKYRRARLVFEIPSTANRSWEPAVHLRRVAFRYRADLTSVWSTLDRIFVADSAREARNGSFRRNYRENANGTIALRTFDPTVEVAAKYRRLLINYPREINTRNAKNYSARYTNCDV